ncbi:hypothetical protein CEXT_768221 [Caerostris extrusa]|uniref:Uncharacterized protein n=1 Tax=Caerostris extrusa TaxID=172846 RepID=A0AAV4QVU4_CAEEX|nr:hypothetical protein CEXT_768221 [Caerostris extrusa]
MFRGKAASRFETFNMNVRHHTREPVFIFRKDRTPFEACPKTDTRQSENLRFCCFLSHLTHREQKNQHVYFEQSKTDRENEITRNHVLKLGELHSNPLFGDGLFSSEEWQHANRQTIRARAIDFKGHKREEE